MLKMSLRTQADLSWYMRDAHGAVSGLKGQVYERSGGSCQSDPECITERQLRDADKYRRLDSIRMRLISMEGGFAAWCDLRVAYGPQPRWVASGDDDEPSIAKQKVMPEELLYLAPHTPTAIARGAELYAEGKPDLLATETQLAIDAIRRAASAPKKSAPWITQVRVEARDMLECATHLYETARRQLEDEARVALRAPEVDSLAAAYALLERMGQTA